MNPHKQETLPMKIGVVFPRTETDNDSAIIRDFAQMVEGMFEA
jgi:hypothetical protein